MNRLRLLFSVTGLILMLATPLGVVSQPGYDQLPDDFTPINSGIFE